MHFWIKTILLSSCALLLSSCGKQESRNSLRIGNGAEPRTLDPQQAVSLAEAHVITALFEGLLSEPSTDDALFEPGIATSWEANEKLTQYSFTLRENARWSDGTPINADTFLSSFERILNPQLSAQNSELLFDIKNAKAYHMGEIKSFDQVGLSAPSEYTLVITLEQPTAVFLQKMKHWSWFPVPVHFIEQKGGLYDIANPWASSNDLVSNGPYMLDRWQRNQRITIAKNEAYWDAPTISIERVEFYPFENTQSEYRAFLAGQLDITEEIPSELKDQKLDGARADPLLATSYLLLNNEFPSLSDPNVRRALSAAIDRGKLIKSIVKTGFPASRFTPAAMPLYPLGDTSPPPAPELPRELVAQINANGPLRLVVSNRDVSIAVAEALQEMWRRELGIEIRIENMEFKSFLDRLDNGDYDISYIAWFGDYLDPFTFLGIWQSESQYNRARWENSSFDKLLDQSATQADPAQRLETLHKAEDLLTEQMPIIPLFWKSKDYLVSPHVRNWPASLTDIRSYKHVELKH
ncbi:peptide ABC transporter substrate-binding protein [Pelagicoccus sp. SDUM812002]|uniref:peptide ABC transporter substrate-binding protein n=1 Tax=Pelagicoccus sp. SDUM812002 TaxID=3041266 RepID=UPI00280D8467|nr:peptide ABC transporter substrate-binding protein [Pelagicoccus sp. SDUM812002]MDQ8187982.1 peptide ABC transporter substrate-binding protein [Pelagicoccus sp. SDUM812002]